MYIRPWYISYNFEGLPSRVSCSILTLLGNKGFLLYIRSGTSMTLLGSSSNQYEIYHCRIYSRKLLMMGRGNAQNM